MEINRCAIVLSCLATLGLGSIRETHAQVGIGTTNPTADLDVNGTLRVRDMTLTAVSNIVAADDSGNLGILEAFYPYNLETVVASNPIDVGVNGNNQINNIDLGLSIVIDVPANKEARVLIFYSVPIGKPDFLFPTTGSYVGIRFLKDGVEQEAASRKAVIPNVASSANIVLVSSLYLDIIAPDPSPRTFTYTLNGYIEQVSTDMQQYRFNMWDSVGPNYNWGKGSIIQWTYLK